MNEDIQRPEFVPAEQERPVVIVHGNGRLHVEYKPRIDLDTVYRFFNTDKFVHLHVEYEGTTQKLTIGLDELRILYEECGRRIVEIEAMQKAIEDYRQEYERYRDWRETTKAKEGPDYA